MWKRHGARMHEPCRIYEWGYVNTLSTTHTKLYESVIKSYVNKLVVKSDVNKLVV